ncbi:LysR family transcriptional regulator [Reyranella sp. CPCC 100927]|uniref:LysR family transcriptional regulator n=1 Tax=Reyranella sp. CPCC 100927 TaxID=2599616 RepID=UPI0011B6535A|nr:LysR family transcriptional regulator [Reyranella sp. CPCC 100927]TWT02694.1 LysR family transcriptional regulator [Reyranella sp. CPCC 100927]
MDAADLRIFEAVARLGGMNRAATELNTVQSNVTARVRLLEDELRTPLFHRHSRGVTLTPAGHRLLPYAERLAQLLADARRAATDDGTPRGPLVIGSLETTAALRLSPLLSRYAAAWPEVDLVLRTGTTSEMVEQVAARRLEGAMVCGPIDHPELQGEVMFREELVLATTRAVRSLDELIGKGDLKIVVLRAGCSYRQRLEDVLARRGAVGARLLEFGTIEAILGCVAAGLGATLLPRALITTSRYADRIAVHALPVAEAHVETLFIRRRDSYASSALSAFLEQVRPPVLQAAE